MRDPSLWTAGRRRASWPSVVHSGGAPHTSTTSASEAPGGRCGASGGSSRSAIAIAPRANVRHGTIRTFAESDSVGGDSVGGSVDEAQFVSYNIDGSIIAYCGTWRQC